MQTKEINQLKNEIENILNDNKAAEIISIDLKDKTSIADFMIIARVESLISGLSMETALKRAEAYEDAGADAILIHSKQKNPDEIFEFADSFKGNCPVVVIPTTYDTVKINELESHNIKMVIYANQTLRAAHKSMMNLLKILKNSENISSVNDKLSSMESIFELQSMYEIENKEKELEEKLKKLGYIN